MTPQLQRRLDRAVDGIVERMDRFQKNYVKAHPKKRYWQGLCTHSTPPADGTPALADRLDATTPRLDAWPAQLRGLVQSLPVSAEIHQYVGKQGAGYVCMFKARETGKTWIRQVNRGPETHRERGWEKLVTSWETDQELRNSNAGSQA